MIDENKNKMMSTAPSTKQLYHFAGSGIYLPMAIEAQSSEAAEKEWLKKRQPVELPPGTGISVGEKKTT